MLVTSAAQIQSLALELPYISEVAIKKKNNNNKIKKTHPSQGTGHTHINAAAIPKGCLAASLPQTEQVRQKTHADSEIQSPHSAREGKETSIASGSQFSVTSPEVLVLITSLAIYRHI